MSATKGYGCPEHPEWSSVMVPVWLGWWLPRLHVWLHEVSHGHRPTPPGVRDMSGFMRSEGTDPATSNLIAGVVSDVWRAYFGDEWVPFSVRYGIAHEVQRRLAQPTDDSSSGGDPS